ncbi:MAG: hypothetical protein HC813_00270 [Planctomycetes bacterium]|nr:hypothetical protein [Planctomycetota bacterium]
MGDTVQRGREADAGSNGLTSAHLKNRPFVGGRIPGRERNEPRAGGGKDFEALRVDSHAHRQWDLPARIVQHGGVVDEDFPACLPVDPGDHGIMGCAPLSEAEFLDIKFSHLQPCELDLRGGAFPSVADLIEDERKQGERYERENSRPPLQEADAPEE